MKVKMIATLMVLTFLVMSLSACSKSTGVQNTKESADKMIIDQKESSKPEVTMGRFMEKNVELPKLKGNESIIKILQNTKKQFEVYTINPISSGYEYYCYREAENMTWERSKPEWLNTSNLLDKKINLIDICVGADGCYYTVINIYGKTTKSKVFRIDNTGTAQSIDITYLDEPVKNINDKNHYPMISKIEVLKSGSIVLQDMWNEKALLVFDSKGKKVDEIICGTSQNFMINNNHIITMNEEGKIIVYNTETKSIDQTIEYSRDINGFTGKVLYTLKKDGTLILGDSKGIHRLPINGTLWETTVDGALNSMSMPSLVMNALFITEGNQEEYYAAYSDNKGYKLKKYVFDSNVSAVPEKEITVYSLMENNTIRQAISLFQSQNTNVKINYVVALSEEGSAVADHIRALNTELLSGNGADILLLDDLPFESYIEKGILSDISDVIKPLKSSGELIGGIQENYFTEGKNYQMPIRFSVPIMMGQENALNSSDSLSNIVEYIRNNNDIPYAASTTPDNLLKDYLALNIDNLFKNDKLNKEQLTSFLNNLKELAKNTSTSGSSSINVTTVSIGGSIIRRYSDDLFQVNIIGGIGSKYATSMLQINNVTEIMLPDAIIKNKNLKYSTLGDRFIPKGLVGLNSTSKEGELAKQFIRFLFTKEIQDTNLYDGLPVLLSSLQNWFDEENPNIQVGTHDLDGKMIVATWPKMDRRKEYLNKILSVKKPIVCNQIINDMIMEHALLFLSDKEDINQATAAICTKVDTYLAE